MCPSEERDTVSRGEVSGVGFLTWKQTFLTFSDRKLGHTYLMNAWMGNNAGIKEDTSDFFYFLARFQRLKQGPKLNIIFKFMPEIKKK